MPRPLVLVLLAWPILLVLTASQVWAASAVLVSGTNPFLGCPFGGAEGSVNYPNAEVEPFVAVNPTSPSKMVGVFQQDRWSDAGAHGLVAARSSDGGSTWATSFAAFSKCSSPPPSDSYDRASDPWVTFDTAGNVYQISLCISATQSISAVLVSMSTHGVATW